MADQRLTRRQFLGLGAGLGAAVSLGVGPGRLIERALAAGPASGPGSLCDIEHVVILIQENRSFDHYFGTMSGVRGFGDPTGLFGQPGYPSPTGHLYPFHLDTQNTSSFAECTNDIDHGWPGQHESWNHGAMDHWVTSHLTTNGAANGPMTMGYYTRSDLAFYYALADAFTVCDGYFCSVLGPTDPNRLYSMSATIDPDGTHGGPLVETLTSTRAQALGKFTWKTMPEALQEAGISWKVYQTPDAQLDDVLLYFKAFNDPTSPLFLNAAVPTFPGSFNIDVATGNLPHVSWVLAPVATSEHPGAAPIHGEEAVSLLLSALVANPAVWERTALFVTYDENGGFFDHVAPPTPPPGTPGEYLTAALPAAAGGVTGPIGLGFRVPTMVISPFSRGGFVCSETFDHTSTLRFLETRFGVPVPNLSAWRRSVTGDLTSAFNFAAPDASVPALPAPPITDPNILRQCATNGLLGTLGMGQTYPIPLNSSAPAQETSPTRRVPSGVLRSC